MSVFWEIVVSNALVVALLALVLTLLGRKWKHPAALHVLWVLLLLKLFLPPVYRIELELPAENAAASSPSPTANQPAGNAELPWSVTYGPKPHTPAAKPAPPQAATTPIRSVPEFSWSTWLLIGWAGVTMLLIVLCWRRVRAFKKILRSGHEPSEELRQTVQHLSRRFGLRRAPPVIMVPVRLSPMVWAVGGRVRIVLPRHLMEQFDSSGRLAILAHELAHIRRGDHVVRWVELAATVFFWWHPAVWWARHQLRELEEQCCDGMVLEALPDTARSYAVSLVETLNFLSETSFLKPLAATGASPGASLARRIAMLKEPRRTSVRLTLGRTLLLLALAAIPMTLALASEPAKPVKDKNKSKPAVTEPSLAGAAADLDPLKLPALPSSVESAGAPKQKANELPPTFDQSWRVAEPNSEQPPDAVPSPQGYLRPIAVRTNTPAQAPTYATAGTSPARKRAIFRLKNAPAIDVAETIENLFKGEVQGPYASKPSVVISPDAVSNCILVSGSEDDIAQIEEFIETLDAPSSMVRVEMLIAEVKTPESEDAAEDVRNRLLGLGKSGGVDSDLFAKELAELREQGVLTVVSRPQIMTLDNQPASVQIGEALIGKPSDGPVPGVTVGLSPRVSDESVTMEIDVEIVRVESAGQAMIATGGDTNKGAELAVQRLVTTTAQTTVSVTDGRTAILGGLVPDADAKDEQLLIVLTPHIVTQGPKRAVARSQRMQGPVSDGTARLPRVVVPDHPGPEEPSRSPAATYPVLGPSAK